MPWSWRKLLAIHPLVRNHFWHSLGNGQNTFAWHDTWATCCPIIDIVTHRMIKEAGFESHSKVVEIIENGSWRLPSFWDNRILNTNVPLLQEHMMDSIKWCTDAGVLHDFSVSLAWEDLRVREPLVDWYHILSCPLCSTQPDSHTHLFFDCPFSSRVWDEVNKIAGLSLYGGSWADVLHDLKKIARKNFVHSVVSKLILAGAVYNIWQERNNRLFNQSKRSEDKLIQIIVSTTRLKLMTLRFKNNSRTEAALSHWKLPSSLLIPT
uniref:uncharacterized protein LOC122591572 n=1 Tax=Erigeron canadensis TaxID=72917 RepID=UPI001CB92E8D|nr:uncharacterized protein LOC122591572 [Erigeron canadensis]